MSLGTLVCLPWGDWDMDVFGDIILSTTQELKHGRLGGHFSISHVGNRTWTSLEAIGLPTT